MINNIPVGFIGILHFPHPRVANFKRVSRLVVLPDYQGIGIGTRLLNFVANIYKEKGFRVRIVTSNPALLYSLGKDWKCVAMGRMGKQNGLPMMNKTIASDRIVGSFELR